MGLILDKYNLAQKFVTKTMPIFQNNEIFQKIDYAGSINVLNKRIEKAKTKKELDEIIKVIDKNIINMKKMKNTRLNKGNVIPVMDKKLKERNYNNFLIEMNRLRVKAEKKKKIIRE